MRATFWYGCLAVTLAQVAALGDAEACGGATVANGSVSAAAQRIVLSVHGGKTDVVAQVAVPDGPAAYGMLIPVAAVPTLDTVPVASSELDVLDAATQVEIVRSSDGGGCGGGCAGDSAAGPGSGSVVVTPPVAIGPVTAVVLSGSDGAAVAAWLADNGFNLPPGEVTLIDAYAGEGRYFIALKKGDGATGATSIGVHFTVDGDQRGMPLRLIRVGASAQIALIVFLATPAPAGPSAPFAGLTVADLDRQTVRDAGYPAALAAAVTAHGSRAFVAEDQVTIRGDEGFLGERLAQIIVPGQTLTRYSTLVDAAALTADMDFAGPSPANVSRVIASAPPRHGGSGTSLAFALFAFAAIRGRRLVSDKVFRADRAIAATSGRARRGEATSETVRTVAGGRGGRRGPWRAGAGTAPRPGGGSARAPRR